MNGARRAGGSGGRRRARWMAVGVAAASVVGALPAAAGAADYCVAPNTGCGPTNVASVEQALDLADDATDADRVFLGATDYTAPNVGGFQYYQSNGAVEIVGEGAGQTILTSPGGGGDCVVCLAGGPGTSIHDLTIRVPQNAVSGLMAIHTTNTARRIEVIEDPTQANTRSGVGLEDGGTLEDSSVTLGDTSETRAVSFGLGGGTVRRSVLSAWTGVLSRDGGTIERSRVTGADAGVLGKGNVTTITGSVIRFTNGAGAGIAAHSRPGFHTIVNADGVTIVGPGGPNTSGAFVGLEPAPDANADVNMTNSIIRGVSAALSAVPANGTGQANITASYTDYDPSGNVAEGAKASISQTSVSNVGDAGFVDAAGGDYHLLPGSPLIDTGDPAAPQGLDLDGDPLVADGNGDGGARRDLGAFELQPAPAGDGQPPAGAGQQGGTAGADTEAPLVSGFGAAPSVFALARAGTPVVARVPRGTRFRYTLSEAAQVRVTIQRALAGRRRRGRCVPPAPQPLRAKRCTRYRTIGTLTRTGTTGANRIRFSGRIGERALRPGSYRAVITATDAAGNRSTPKRTRFRVTGS